MWWRRISLWGRWMGLRAINGDGPFLATGEEGLRDMRIIEAIYESARTGKSVKI